MKDLTIYDKMGNPIGKKTIKDDELVDIKWNNFIHDCKSIDEEGSPDYVVGFMNSKSVKFKTEL